MEKEEYYNSCREEMKPFLPSSIRRSIEFGCGYGIFSAFIREKFRAEVWGVDLNPGAAVKAVSLLDKVIESEAIAAVDLLPDKYFDCIVCNDLLEHLTNPDIFIARLRQKVTPDAVMVASVPNVRHFKTIKNLLLHKDWKYTDKGVLDKTHLRFFTEKSLKRFLQENKMSPELFEGINRWKSFRLEILNLLLAGFLSDMFFLQFGFRAKFS
jgi:2-polyprenyl-3-methyl-5-hydroxy-6-metoxy-1,4-benzoquinol methylase